MPDSSVPEPPEGPRRVFVREGGPRKKKRLKDVDAAARARLIRAMAWGAIPGFIIGASGGGYFAYEVAEGLFLLGALVGGLLGVGVGVGVPLAITSISGWALLSLLGLSGRAQPRRPEYSYAESLVARGRFEKAIAAYEEAIRENPAVAEPYLRIARILRDELDRPDEAAWWFRRARREAEVALGQDIYISRELVELWRNRLGEPARALPELARMAERYPGTPDGEWAEQERRALKTELNQRAEEA